MFSKCWIMGFLLLASQLQAGCEGSGCQCSASSTGVNFGIYNTLSNLAKDITGTARVTCSSSKSNAFVSYQIKFSTGSSGSFSSRTMKFGTRSLFYNLFLNANRTQIWGNGSNNTQFQTDSYHMNRSVITKNYTIYGRVAGGQNAVAGTYQDTIIMTVIY